VSLDELLAGRERFEAMQIGMIGLGRMGANLVRRLMGHGHECVVYHLNMEVVRQLHSEGAIGSSSLDDFVAKLVPPRTTWVMVPAGFAAATISAMAERLQRGDIIIDGGNSYYRDDIVRAGTLEATGIHYVDVGTSGGIFGLERGFCLMIGGQAETVAHLEPVFATLAPGAESAERTPGRDGGP
jgi:6-phosphogluconate dehydrogenase